MIIFSRKTIKKLIYQINCMSIKLVGLLQVLSEYKLYVNQSQDLRTDKVNTVIATVL